MVEGGGSNFYKPERAYLFILYSTKITNLLTLVFHIFSFPLSKIVAKDDPEVLILLPPLPQARTTGTHHHVGPLGG